MDHSLPHPDVRPWRTATLVASAVAFLELVALLAIAAFALSKPLATHVTAASAASTPSRAHARVNKHAQAPRARLARSETSVIVLNGSGITGAAAAEATRVEGRGYVVASVGNAPRSDYAHTLVMYRPGYRAEGLRLARDLGLGARAAVPLDGLKTSDLLGAHAAVILGT